MYIISLINKINNITKDKCVFVDDSLCSFTSRWGKKQKVGAIKNGRLVPDYLQTCNSIFLFIYVYFLPKNDKNA